MSDLTTGTCAVWPDELRSPAMTAIDTNPTSMSASTTDNYWSKLQCLIARAAGMTPPEASNRFTGIELAADQPGAHARRVRAPTSMASGVRHPARIGLAGPAAGLYAVWVRSP
jgi:hypothetical protein